MHSPRLLVKKALGYAFAVGEKLRACVWISRHVVIPDGVGAKEPGPLDTSRVPPMEGLYDLIEQRHVHFFTLAKSARVGGTLFCFAYLLLRLARNPGPILWVDPSRSTMRQLWRRELEAYLLACKPVAEQAIRDKERWNPSQAFFGSGAFLKMAGSGSPAEMAGFNSEVAFINEGDKTGHTSKGEAPTRELVIVRTKQFSHTRKIIENSTPTDKFGQTWRSFLKGSQHHCYLPCPHCSDTGPEFAGTTLGFVPPQDPAPGRSPYSYDPGLRGWQRLTFFAEDKEVPFDTDLRPMPPGSTRQERTGQFKFDHCRILETREVEPGKFEPVAVGWNYEKVEAETRYECAHCGKEIEHRWLSWMLRRFWWVGHNPGAARDHVSAHFWAGYSPFEHWGETAKRFLLANGDAGALHDIWNSDYGLPFNPTHTEVEEEDIDKLVKASPHYLVGGFPYEPEGLTMCVDVQRSANNPLWWSVWAWGILWDLPDWPTFAALVDYGPATGWEQIEEIAGIRAKANGQFNRYRWRNPNNPEQVREYSVTAGLVDSGDQAQQDANVYDFTYRNSAIFSPCKGGSKQHLRGELVRHSEVYDKKLQLRWFFDDYWKQRLYHHCIKARRYHRFLPSNLDPVFIEQLTDVRLPRFCRHGGAWQLVG